MDSTQNSSETSKSLFILIPGFGRPHREHKIEILRTNLNIISLLYFTRLFRKVYITICLYDVDTDTREDQIQLIQCIQSILRDVQVKCPGFFEFHIPSAPGIVGQFMIRHASPESLLELDASIAYCMILLDDVEFNADEWTSDTWSRIFYDYHRHRLNILSPTMSLNSKYLFPYMLQRKYPENVDTLSITSACELFCYIMSFETWCMYYKELREEHPLLWGIDLVLTKHLGFRVGMIHYATLRHHYQTVQHPYSETSIEAFRQMELYLRKFNETQHTLAHQPAILEDIHIYHRNKTT